MTRILLAAAALGLVLPALAGPAATPAGDAFPHRGCSFPRSDCEK